MKLSNEEEKKIISIRYYNVMFYLVYEASVGEFKIEQLMKRINSGERMTMRMLAYWCGIQNIKYSTKFTYRRDFDFNANIWNFYSYCRFLIRQLKTND